MNRKNVFFYVFGIAVSFALLFLFGFVFSQRAEAQTNTPTPTPTPTLRSDFTPVRSATPIPIPTTIRLPKNPKPLCGRCYPEDLTKLWEILLQRQEFGVFTIDPTRTNWSMQLDALQLDAPANSPVTVRTLRALDDLGMVEERGGWIADFDSSGSLALSGEVPPFAPGGKYVGIACTLSDCSMENIWKNLGSPSIVLWQFEMPSPIQISDESVTKEGDPYIGVDFQLREGLSKEAISAALWKDSELPVAITDNPLFSFAQPFMVKQDNRIEIYPAGTFLPSWANATFGTQFYVPPITSGDYHVAVGVNDAFEESIKIPVNLPGCAGC